MLFATSNVIAIKKGKIKLIYKLYISFSPLFRSYPIYSHYLILYTSCFNAFNTFLLGSTFLFSYFTQP
jgi:hypothetical protein